MCWVYSSDGKNENTKIWKGILLRRKGQTIKTNLVDDMNWAGMVQNSPTKKFGITDV
jgi:hypothetical protein